MKKTFTLSILSLFFSVLLSGQQVWQLGIQKTNVDLNSLQNLGEISIEAPSSGKVVVRLDGSCTADPGDRIILAASDNPSWTGNDGAIGIEVIDTDINKRSFSHTRVYDVTPGNHSFYAVGQNYVETDGSGIASVYASLTVKYYPDDAGYIISHSGIASSNMDLADATVIEDINISPSTHGKAIVRFDGICYADPGDRIILAASNDGNWHVNDGAVGVEAFDNDVNFIPFSHTRVYDVSSGLNTFSAVGHNYVETDGSGIASVYGSLTVEFIPDGDMLVGFTGIQEQFTDLSNATAVADLELSPAMPGKVLVSFDGGCFPDVGDRIILAASNNGSWTANDGNVGVEAYDNDLNRGLFSHSRLYDVSAGMQSFYAVAHNYVETDGDGTGSIYGSLTAQFFPQDASGVNTLQENRKITLYPNPVNDILKLEFRDFQNARLEIRSSNGKLLYQGQVIGRSAEVSLGQFPVGLYILKVETENGIERSKFIKH